VDLLPQESEDRTPAQEDEDNSASATSSWNHYDSARLRHLEMENSQIRASEAAALERERQVRPGYKISLLVYLEA
jgi:predicted dithiol-disulfide oxidoreductase (DUF899 family)